MLQADGGEDYVGVPVAGVVAVLGLMDGGVKGDVVLRELGVAPGVERGGRLVRVELVRELQDEAVLNGR